VKIVISPSKTQELKRHTLLDDKEPFFLKEHKKVLATMRKMSKNDIEKAYKIKGNLLEQTYQNIKRYNTQKGYHAFPSFTGLVYKQLQIPTYKEEEFEYIKKHIRILDAFYGVLEPGTLIKNYRLDMKTKLGLNLYKLYDLDSYFKDEVIINLASNEFSSMLSLPLINIHFRTQKGMEYRNLATYSKMARGLFLEYLIQSKTEKLAEMKNFSLNGYSYNKELSDTSNYYFTKTA
jgi:hypothetical protein